MLGIYTDLYSLMSWTPHLLKESFSLQRASFYRNPENQKSIEVKMWSVFDFKIQFLQLKMLLNIFCGPHVLVNMLDSDQLAPTETTDGLLWDVLPQELRLNLHSSVPFKCCGIESVCQRAQSVPREYPPHHYTSSSSPSRYRTDPCFHVYAKF